MELYGDYLKRYVYYNMQIKFIIRLQETKQEYTHIDIVLRVPIE
jgi:hypothetical protein